MKKKILISTLLLALFTSACSSQTPNSVKSQNPSSGTSIPNEETKYTITWLNSDGSTQLKQEQVSEGAVPNYGDTSTLQPTEGVQREGYTYAFKAWSPTPIKAYCDMTYQATYTLTQKEYTVIWHDSDKSTELDKQTNVKFGTVPTYQGQAPTKDGFVFTGWLDEDGNKPVHAITGDTTYYAQYKQDPTKEGFDLNINCTGCSIKDERGVYYTHYTKHFTEAQTGDIILQFTLDSEHHDYPYELATVTNATNYDYDIDTGTLTIHNLASSETFTAIAQNSYIHATYSASTGSVGINVKSAGAVIDWGDNQIDKVDAASVINHEYSSSNADHYIIKIYGTSDFAFSQDDGDAIAGNQNITYLRTYTNLTAIKNHQFARLVGLESLNLTKNIISIGDNAFAYTMLSSFTVPSSVTSIGTGAFTNCNQLKSLFIPKSVTTVGAGITSAKTTSYCSIEAKPDGWDSNWNIATTKSPVYWGYDFSEEDANFEYVNYHSADASPLQLTAIKSYKANADEVQIPTSYVDRNNVSRQVNLIGDHAFEGKTSIERVNFTPSTASQDAPGSIGDYAFSGCTNLEYLDLTQVTGVPKLGEHVFDDCKFTSEESIYVPSYLYLNFMDDTTWASYKQYIHIPELDLHADSEHLDITALSVPIPGAPVDFKITPRTGYELPSKITLTINDGVKTPTTIDVVPTGGVGTFSYTSDATSTRIDFSAEIYKVSFDANGGKFPDSTILKTNYYDKGETLVQPSDPSRDSSLFKTYAFSGWDSTIVTTVNADATYLAQWNETDIKYTITWKYKDATGTEQTAVDELAYGSTPSAPIVPAKYEITTDPVHVYTFTNTWSTPIRPVDGDETYEAQYIQSFKSYTVKWLNGDGTVLKTEENVAYGTVPVYSGEDPTLVKEGHAFTWKHEWDRVSPLTDTNQIVTINPIFDEKVYFELILEHCSYYGTTHAVVPYDFGGTGPSGLGIAADNGYKFVVSSSAPENYLLYFDDTQITLPDPDSRFIISMDSIHRLTLKLNVPIKFNIKLTIKAVPIV